VPRVATIFGVAIYIYEGDHGLPHFHARYQGKAAKIEIATLKLVAGGLPRARLRDVRTWAKQNQALLTAKWDEFNSEED
jgi:hypothetical protein